jgi:hypothetical protein
VTLLRRDHEDVDVERYEQAYAWRSQVLPYMREGLAQLRRAHDGCHDTTMERLKLDQSIKLLREAIRETERSMTVARKIVDREKKRTR